MFAYFFLVPFYALHDVRSNAIVLMKKGNRSNKSYPNETQGHIALCEGLFY